MNIKEYYSFMIKVYVNQMVLVGIFTTICLFVLYSFGTIFILLNVICITLALLLYLFFRFLYFIHQESKSTSKSMSIATSRMQSNHFLLMFLPAPSLHVKFFKSDGIVEWYLCDEKIKKWKWFLPPALNEWTKQSYILKKRDGEKLADFKLVNNGQLSAIISLANEKISLFLTEKTRSKIIFNNESQKYSIEKNPSAIDIFKDKQKICTIGKGWMPIKWQKHFSPNTPIMEINENVNDHDRYVILCFMIFLFANHRN